MKLSKKLLNLLTKEIYQQIDEFKDKIVPKCYFKEILITQEKKGENEYELDFYEVILSIKKVNKDISEEKEDK